MGNKTSEPETWLRSKKIKKSNTGVEVLSVSSFCTCFTGAFYFEAAHEPCLKTHSFTHSITLSITHIHLLIFNNRFILVWVTEPIPGIVNSRWKEYCTWIGHQFIAHTPSQFILAKAPAAINLGHGWKTRELAGNPHGHRENTQHSADSNQSSGSN